mgnify:CR=1 FL=1
MNNQQNDDMDRQTLNVAFATQKGGSGKTAITVLVAGYLHYRLGCPLAVIDCDFPQYSLYEMRERDSRAVLENEHLKRAAYEQMRQPGRAAYPVRKCRVEQAPDTARELAAEGCYDLLFFDLPGTVNSAGILRTIAQMDYIFAPISADRLVVESTLQFAALFHENLITTGIAKTKGLYLFWTMVDGRERSELYDLYRQIIDGMNIPMLETRLPDSKRFRRDLSEERKAIFRSTIFPMDNALMRGSNIKELAEEICSVMKIQRV